MRVRDKRPLGAASDEEGALAHVSSLPSSKMHMLDPSHSTGRKDDVIVLSSGEKVVPIPQEGRIGASPLAGGALMFGRARDQCGILIEPADGVYVDASDETSLAKFRNQIW